MSITTQQIIDALVCSNGYSDQTLHLAIKQAVERLEELEADKDAADSKKEQFVDTAAIQIFTAMILSAERISYIQKSDAAICWEFAEMLFDQKPKAVAAA
jgi:hypothetical protein